jgi:predicted amidohydrolase
MPVRVREKIEGMQDRIKIAGVQMDPKISQKKDNMEKILAQTRIAAGKGSNLIVFPECAVSGYMYSGCAEAISVVETVPGPATEAIAAVCSELKVYVVAGLLERTNNKCYNTAVLIGPRGLIGRYRKNHLPYLGIDRYLDSGNEPFKVYPTDIGNIGLFICYDCTFPESARVMALQGAEILVLPTNWPQGRLKVPQHVIITRAFENKVHLVAVDRVGTERGAKFLGLSKIINAWGDTLAEAGQEDEEIIYGEVNLSEAREKHVIIKPGEFEADFIRDRKPELYGKIVESK